MITTIVKTVAEGRLVFRIPSDAPYLDDDRISCVLSPYIHKRIRITIEELGE